MACSAGTSNTSQLFSGYKVVKTTVDVGLMTADNKEEKIKVAMPYESNMHAKGKEFVMFSGKSVDAASSDMEVKA
jgi:hypothetical protein